jgi:hypothetical protein
MTKFGLQFPLVVAGLLAAGLLATVLQRSENIRILVSGQYWTDSLKGRFVMLKVARQEPGDFSRNHKMALKRNHDKPQVSKEAC